MWRFYYVGQDQIMSIIDTCEFVTSMDENRKSLYPIDAFLAKYSFQKMNFLFNRDLMHCQRDI